MNDPEPVRISLPELYAAMMEMEEAVGEVLDVEAGLADVLRRIDAEGKWMCPHCNDIYGPEDAEHGDVPPVCSGCKKAGRT